MTKIKLDIDQIEDLPISKVIGLEDALVNTSSEATVFSELGGAPDYTQTIAQAYPSVTLTDVQAVNSSATLSDSASWFYLQSGVNKQNNVGFYAFKDNQHVKIPNGQYYMSRPLELGESAGATFDFTDTYLKPSTGYTGFLVSIINDSSNQAYIWIKNLKISGEWRAKGIDCMRFQQLSFEDLLIEKVVLGVEMRGVWYSNFLGTSTVRDCLNAIKFTSTQNQSFDEVNGTGFYGLSIRAASADNLIDVSKFNVASNYQTKAFEIETRTLGGKFNDMTIEGFVHAFYLTDLNNGGVDNKFRSNITGNYFEANDNIFYFSPTLSVSTVDMTFKGNLINNSVNAESYFTYKQGNVEFSGNMLADYNRYKITILDGPDNVFSNLVTDLLPSNVVNLDASFGTRVTYENQKISTTEWDRFTYGTTNFGTFNPIDRKVTANQMQDVEGFVAVAPESVPTLSSQNLHYKKAYQNSLKDISFIDKNKGVILKDRTTDKAYRLSIDNGEFFFEEEIIADKVYDVVGVKQPNFFIRHTDPVSISGLYYMQGMYTAPMVWDGTMWTSGGIRRIGTSAEKSTTGTYYDTTLGKFVRGAGETYVINGENKIEPISKSDLESSNALQWVDITGNKTIVKEELGSIQELNLEATYHITIPTQVNEEFEGNGVITFENQLATGKIIIEPETGIELPRLQLTGENAWGSIFRKAEDVWRYKGFGLYVNDSPEIYTVLNALSKSNNTDATTGLVTSSATVTSESEVVNGETIFVAQATSVDPPTQFSRFFGNSNVNAAGSGVAYEYSFWARAIAATIGSQSVTIGGGVATSARHILTADWAYYSGEAVTAGTNIISLDANTNRNATTGGLAGVAGDTVQVANYSLKRKEE